MLSSSQPRSYGAADDRAIDKSGGRPTLPTDTSVAGVIASADDKEPARVLWGSDVGPTPRRWAVLAAFSSLSALNCMTWIAFAPCRNGAMAYYNVSGVAIDWLSMVFMVSYPVVFAPMLWYIENGGPSLMRGLRMSAFLTFVGAVVRFMAGSNFVVLAIGQTICATAQGFTLAAPPRLAGLWFGEHEWGLATGIGVLANQVGAVLGYLIVPAVVNDVTGVGFRSLLLGQVIAIFLCGVFIYFAIPENPTHPPSLVALHRGEEPSRSLAAYLASAIDMCSSASILLLCLGYGLAISCLYTFETLLLELLPGMTPLQLASLGTSSLAVGMVGCVFGGWILDRTQLYKGANIAFILGSAAIVCALAALSDQVPDAYAGVLVLSMALIFCLCGHLTAGFELGVELSFPTPESTVAGVLNCFAQVTGVFMIYFTRFFNVRQGAAASFIVLLVALLLSALGFVLVPGMQKRQAARKQEVSAA